MQDKKLKLWGFVLILSMISCGSAGSAVLKSPTNEKTPDVVEGTPVHLTFTFSNQTDASDDKYDSIIEYPDSYTVPLYIQENGLVMMQANEFPRMVLRICAANSNANGCDIKLSEGIQIGATDVQEAVDLVLDSCGYEVDDSQCGQEDSTYFSGALKSDGSLTINGIALRVRIFLVKSNTDGFRANNTDSGLLTLERIRARVTTDTVNTGVLSATGSVVQDKQITLVAGGIIPTSMPELGGAYYLSTLQGQFDVDPLEIIE